jgi:nitrite reductase/ring-hydroxylating ferredoxin subunit
MTDQPDRPSGSDEPQPLVGFRTNAEWDALLERVDAMIAAAEAIADPGTRRLVLDLLQGIDCLHREALTRLVRLFKEGVLEKVLTDPPIRTLLELYDLAPPSGGNVPDFITGYPPPRSAPRHVATEPAIAARVPIPHWVPALPSFEHLSPGTATIVTADNRDLLIARVGSEAFALAGRCVRDGALMAGGKLTRYTYACPHHAGCYYDVRRGSRIGAAGALECYTARVDDDGRVLVGIGMPFEPRLPAL